MLAQPFASHTKHRTLHNVAGVGDAVEVDGIRFDQSKCDYFDQREEDVRTFDPDAGSPRLGSSLTAETMCLVVRASFSVALLCLADKFNCTLRTKPLAGN